MQHIKADQHFTRNISQPALEMILSLSKKINQLEAEVKQLRKSTKLQNLA